MWDLPCGPGMEPVSFALTGEFITVGPPAKPSIPANLHPAPYWCSLRRLKRWGWGDAVSRIPGHRPKHLRIISYVPRREDIPNKGPESTSRLKAGSLEPPSCLPQGCLTSGQADLSTLSSGTSRSFRPHQPPCLGALTPARTLPDALGRHLERLALLFPETHDVSPKPFTPSGCAW